jgi:uncharacterized membrane protein
MTYPEKTRSNLWFLVPILFGVLGGIVAFFILRKDDPKKAKNCLYVGIALMVAGLVINAIIAAAIPEFDSGFRVKI